jgi:hypothetical protein
VERLRVNASVFGSLCRRLAVAAVVIGLGAASAVAARPSRVPAPAIGTTGTNPISVRLPLRAAIVSRSTAGSVLTLSIACKNGSAIEVCSGPIMLTATGGQKIGSASYSVVTGKQTTVTIPLDTAGQNLLSKSYKLTAMLSVAGTTTLARTVHFHYPRMVAPISFTWEFAPSYTTATQLAVSGVPAGGTVKAICQGGGCPYANNTFSPGGGGDVNLEPSLKGSHLRPHATLSLEITATNYVGKVAIFTIESGRQPNLVEKCLPPGATSASRCA